MKFSSLAVVALATAMLSVTVPAVTQTGPTSFPSDPFPTFAIDGCGSQPWFIFFDTDREEAHGRTLRVLDWTFERFTRDSEFVLLSGNMDADEYGRQPQGDLDLKRAEWVRDELQRRGIESSRIWVRFKGFTRPMVPTEIGVSEVQNRRVDIILSNFGSACWRDQHRLRVDWLLRNCLGDSAVRYEFSCRIGLEAVREGY